MNLMSIFFTKLIPLLPPQGSLTALILNSSISLSTGCLLVFIIAFHYKDIRVSLSAMPAWTNSLLSLKHRFSAFTPAHRQVCFELVALRMFLCRRYLWANVLGGALASLRVASTLIICVLFTVEREKPRIKPLSSKTHRTDLLSVHVTCFFFLSGDLPLMKCFTLNENMHASVIPSRLVHSAGGGSVRAALRLLLAAHMAD